MEELREIISNTEKDEHLKAKQRLNALKDGEKILVERTSELARTRNELQKQTTEYHQLNADIARARKDLNQLDAAVKKKNIEIEDVAARKEEERAYHEAILEVRVRIRPPYLGQVINRQPTTSRQTTRPPRTIIEQPELGRVRRSVTNRITLYPLPFDRQPDQLSNTRSGFMLVRLYVNWSIVVGQTGCGSIYNQVVDWSIFGRSGRCHR